MRKFKARQQTKNGARACSLSQVQSCGQKLQLSPVGGLLMMIKGFGDWMLDVGDWGSRTKSTGQGENNKLI